MTTGSLTVLFEDPFWIGLFEMIDQNGLRVCKVTFGAEPTEKEVMEFVDKNWNHLQFTQPIETPTTSESKKNPKRQLREAKKQMQSQGIGTKSQQALKLQQEQNKAERKHRSKAEREAEKNVSLTCARPRRKRNIKVIDNKNEKDETQDF